MRIPHYLIRNASGCFVFRLRVPSRLQALLGRKVIKHALRTQCVRAAQQHALILAERYARAFEHFGWHRMPRGPSVEDILANVAEGGLSRYEIDLASGRVQASDAEDHRRAMEALALIGRIDHLRQPSAAPPASTVLPPAAVAPTAPAVAEPLTMKQAKIAWLRSIEASTTKKTLSIKTAAVEDLVRFIGEKRQLHALGRPDLAKWYQFLRDDGIATPTLTNKQSYIGGKHGFFSWAMASGHYPPGDNPAKGHVSYTANEKRKRKKFGFKAFTREEIALLFAPENFETLPLHTRWACLIGLYTGARVSEVGQLRVLDVIELEGVPCLSFSDEGEHQSLKSESSRRVVPIHPRLLKLGLLDYVKTQVRRNARDLFPNGKEDAVNGRGSWITKAMGNYLAKIGSSWPKAKRGFHSFRKSVIQELQGAGVASEMRAQLVGHELDDEHHAVYSREFTPREKLTGVRSAQFSSPGLSALAFDINVDAVIRPVNT
ncbi:site-specific integrase [Luteimonas fraxinea]|uniref:site-specific integrase n=1 Tax=Luteimonas fraxinea TaxID=2901869 RepID=UPI001E5F02CC|nr:site-specific integrase [Luteimonas fraxinea]UHH09669.1 site-specific integrase [Luteimonas fraxinea]